MPPNNEKEYKTSQPFAMNHVADIIDIFGHNSIPSGRYKVLSYSLNEEKSIITYTISAITLIK